MTSQLVAELLEEAARLAAHVGLDKAQDKITEAQRVISSLRREQD